MLTVRKLDKKDFATAARYGAVGMHFDWYAHGWGLRLYRWFFFHEMLNKATRAWGCYYRGYFQGALLARIEGEQPLYRNPFMSALVKIADWLIRHFDIAGMDNYDEANEAMLAAFKNNLAQKDSTKLSPTYAKKGSTTSNYVSDEVSAGASFSATKRSTPHGVEVGPQESTRTALQEPSAEILFLTANPKGRVRGVGSALLDQFERAAAGRLAYLYTDTGCTYPFYEHRGFTCEGEKDIEVKHGKSSFTLTCFLYAKQL